MLLLALDTCDSDGSLAVLRDDSVLYSATRDTAQDYSSWLLPAVETGLQATGITLETLDAYAVATGPGSFTGVRVGLTTVKAWAEVYGRPIVGVSRLEALASRASRQRRYLAAFADAHRGQVFGAIYRGNAGFERIDQEMVIAPEDFVTWVAQKAGADPVRWISPDPQCIVATRSWSARVAAGDTVETALPPFAPAIGELARQRVLGRHFSDALTLDANYVRRSDAEIFWKSGPTAR